LSQSEQVIEHIHEFGADVVFVAFGAPWQERWIIEHKKSIKTRVIMGVGGAFDIWAQKIPRAPLGWRKIGLEWLWRLIHEPWRIKRQLRLVKFLGMVVTG
jgi:N-acetylglucosaminyldiphosphoundecaprenol N-acetyl-beta-D-mannosaminyltransferase